MFRMKSSTDVFWRDSSLNYLFINPFVIFISYAWKYGLRVKQYELHSVIPFTYSKLVETSTLCYYNSVL